MSLLYRRFSRLPNYVRAFGVISGLKLLLQVERNLTARSTELRSYEVPKARASVWLRDSVSDHAIFWQCLVMHHYDFSRFPQYQRFRKTYDQMTRAGKRPLIIDCGGNIGLSAIWFALNFPESQIFVLEPEAANYELLCKNIAPYSDIIQPVKGGIWARSDQLAIKNPNAGAAAFMVQAATAADEGSVRAYTIDELLRMAESPEALIVKLDIEGAQKSLFEENTAWVERCHLIILELDDWLFPWAGTSRPFFRCISQFAFDYLLGGEQIFCFRDFEEKSDPRR